MDGKKTDKERMEDSRGIYVGESSRSMYERGKEHQKDGKDRAEDSHQWKHWANEHPDMEGNPRFKFRIIASFSDPLTRQLAESVRIDRRGMEILNSRSEYSRCRVPRLQLDMEGWRKGKKNESVDSNKIKEMDTTCVDAEDQALMEELLKIEQDTRRLDGKRKGDGQGRAKKRRKFDRLIGWGEEVGEPLTRQFESSLQEGKEESSSLQGDMSNWKIGVTENENKSKPIERVVVETENMLKDGLDKSIMKDRRLEKKKEISQQVRKTKFVFNKRGRINQKESKELQRTHKNIFDWVRKEKESMKEKDEFEKKESVENDEPMEVETMEKEERVERMNRRKNAWIAKRICKDIISEVVDGMEEAVTVGMMENCWMRYWPRLRRMGM